VPLINGSFPDYLDLWEKLARHIAVFMEDEAPTDLLGWKDLVCLISRPRDRSVGVLGDVVGT
jgi:hypothetical protein